MASTGELVLFFLGIFAILNIAYGSTVPTGDVQGTLNTITQPISSPQQIYSQLLGGGSKCAPWDLACLASQGIAQATVAIAVIIGYIPYVLFEILYRTLALGVLINQLTQSPTGAGSIPFGSLFMLGLLLFVVFDIAKILRGNPSGV